MVNIIVGYVKCRRKVEMIYYIEFKDDPQEWRLLPASPEIFKFTTLKLRQVQIFEYSPKMHAYITGKRYSVYVDAGDKGTAFMEGSALIDEEIKE